jgi:hypothetical protein
VTELWCSSMKGLFGIRRTINAMRRRNLSFRRDEMRGNRQRFPYEPRVIGGKLLMPDELQAIQLFLPRPLQACAVAPAPAEPRVTQFSAGLFLRD